MKTNFFKKIMMPAAVVILGSGGAFVTTSMSSTKGLANVQGYRFVSQADPCHAQQLCSNVFNPTICTSGSNQLFGKANPNVNVCDVPLYKIP
ncbi:DUF6520 family protein [Flavobacterium humi]|uniref:Uncharacterized protein n=1 Tax=Flavobacterium humi TaxID=2562683 RepID=A0A4Z0L9H8_9FLAO|nr:DUF6520 family protein [Flavobacterium humi]TGD58971.1 hypothetical protein E4635_03725 [Flavobacterium humi]